MKIYEERDRKTHQIGKNAKMKRRRRGGGEERRGEERRGGEERSH